MTTLQTRQAAPAAVAARRPLTALAGVTAAALVGGAASLVYAQALLIHMFRPDLSAFAALELGSAALIVGTRRRWAPLLGTLFGVATVAANSGPVINDLTHPGNFHPFAYMAVAVAFALLMAGAGLAAAAQAYSRPPEARRAPRGLAVALAALAALVAGAIAVAAVPQQAGPAVSPELLAGLPAVTAPGLSFAPSEIHVRAGETVALRLDNPHGAPHSFDIDELGVHVPMPTGRSGLALFKAPAPGTYTFYCGVPGHREAGMVGTLVVGP